MSKQIFIMSHDLARERAKNAIHCAPEGYVVTIQEPTRSLDQNAALWPLLGEIAKQVDWYGEKLTDENWKDMLTAALKKEKIVPGINGGFVVLGQRTSKMNKKDFSELLDFAHAFAADKGVVIPYLDRLEAA